MLDPYTVLGVSPDADDATIRRRYLELTREYPPEHAPERFAAIRSAYEQVKDLDARARYGLFDAGRGDSIEALIREAACRMPRRRFSRSVLLSETPPR
jgi:curved DNA-binding protein CbpA